MSLLIPKHIKYMHTSTNVPVQKLSGLLEHWFLMRQS